jgi:hypothetical protein
MLKSNRVITYFIIIVTLISFSSTAIGLFAWFYSQTTWWEAGLFAGAMSLILQVGIVVFWTLFGRSANVAVKTMALGLALICSLGSATYSTATWLMRTNRTGYETTLTRGNASQLIEPLAQFRHRIGNVSATLSAVAETAKQKAAIEISHGGTCEGVKPQIDCGPACRLRQRQSEEAGSLSQALGVVSQTSSDIVSGIQSDLSRDGLKRGYDKAAVLARDPALSRARFWLENEIHGFDSKFSDPKVGAFVCRDQTFRTQLISAQQALDGDLGLPDLPPEPANVSYSDAAVKSVHDIIGLAEAAATFSIDRAALASVHDNASGLAIATFIEVLLAFLILVDTSEKTKRGVLSTIDEEFIFSIRHLPPGQIRTLAEMAKTIDQLTYRNNVMRQNLFLRPLDGRSDVVSRSAEVVRLFNIPEAPNVRVIPRAAVADWAAYRDELTGGAQQFEVRLLNDRIENQMRIITRDVLHLPPPPANESLSSISSKVLFPMRMPVTNDEGVQSVPLGDKD